MNKTTRVDRREPEVGLVEVVPGLLFPGSGVTVFESHHPSGLTLEVDVVPEDGRLVVDCVRASRGSDGQPVTLVALRQVALKPFLKIALSNAVVTLNVKEGAVLKQALSDEYKGHVFWGLLNVNDRDRLKAQGATDETLRWVALLYRVALALEEPPVKCVAGLGVSLRTASNWVAAARAAGYLTDKEV